MIEAKLVLPAEVVADLKSSRREAGEKPAEVIRYVNGLWRATRELGFFDPQTLYTEWANDPNQDMYPHMFRGISLIEKFQGTLNQHLAQPSRGEEQWWQNPKVHDLIWGHRTPYSHILREEIGFKHMIYGNQRHALAIVYSKGEIPLDRYVNFLFQYPGPEGVFGDVERRLKNYSERNKTDIDEFTPFEAALYLAARNRGVFGKTG